MASESRPEQVLIDGHVHFHDCYDPAEFFDAAAANLRRAAANLGLEGRWLGCLLFTESEGVNGFCSFRDSGATLGSWSIVPTVEDHSFMARSERGPDILVIAGRQIVVAERLEVLAIGRDLTLRDGGGLADTTVAVAESGALPVIPWGFGKWWFQRRSIVRQLIKNPPVKKLLLGDNAGRPGLLPRPRLFRLAEANGIQVLPGSDPLPLPSQVQCVGGHGLLLRLSLSSQPTGDILAALRGLDAPAPSYGKLASPGRFVRSQVAMKLRKRQGAR